MNLLKMRRQKNNMTYSRSLIVLATLGTALLTTVVHAAGIIPKLAASDCTENEYYDTTWYQCRPCGENAIKDDKTGKSILLF